MKYVRTDTLLLRDALACVDVSPFQKMNRRPGKKAKSVKLKPG